MPDAAIPSNLTGTTPPGYTPAYGGAPLIPDPIASMWQAIGGDTAGFPELSNLANMYNLANYHTQQGEVAGTPGFDSVLSNLHGQLPRDVINQLTQGAAERGISTGQSLGDSPNSNAALLSALGTNSLALQDRGQQQYGNLLGHFPMAAPFNMQEFMVSPEQKQAANAAANVSAAAPNPQAAAQAELDALLKSIAAGKGSIPGVGQPPGITPPSVSGGMTAPPGNGQVVASGPQHPTPAPGTWPVNPNTGYYTPPYPVPPNSPGRPPDAIQQGAGPASNSWSLGGTSPNVSSILNTLFNTPGYGDSNVLGMGLNPQLNALFGTAPGTSPRSNGWNWDEPSQNASNGPASDWWNASDPWQGMSDTNWGLPNAPQLPDDPMAQYFNNSPASANPATSNWWEAADPLAALSNIDWGLPTMAPSDPGASQSYDYYGDV